jgi:hypothetical protein
MSLNLNEKLPAKGSAYYTSDSYTDAVNDAQILRTFSFIALAGSALIFIGGFIAVAVGVAVMAFGAKRYYRILGLAVVLLSLGSFGLPVLRIIASLALCAGVAWRATQVLATLAAEGKGDPDWQTTRNRALLALVLSCVGLVISAIWFLLFIIGSFLRSH